jgi:DNA (cytosine-5)-methyltransferase 1
MSSATAELNAPNSPQTLSAVRWSDLLEPRTNDSRKETLHELHLFAGGGGGILGGILLGHEPVCAVEIKPYCRQTLLQRQRDGLLPRFPIWDDVRTFDGTPWRGIADIVCGGFPCQDISVANPNGDGLDGVRSGLWKEMARVVCEVRPRYIFVENSPMLTVRGLGSLLGDVARMGYHAAWCVMGGQEVGCVQQRERIWILACDDLQRMAVGRKYQATPQTRGNGSNNGSGGTSNVRRITQAGENGSVGKTVRGRGWWSDESGMGRVADGLADWLDRQDATGNGQIPAVAAKAWRTLHAQLSGSNDRS